MVATVSPTMGLPPELVERLLDQRAEAPLGPGEGVVQRPLEAGAGPAHRRVADDVRRELPLRVAAEVERLAAARSRARFAGEHAARARRSARAGSRTPPRAGSRCPAARRAPAAPRSASTSSPTTSATSSPIAIQPTRMIWRFTAAAPRDGAVGDEQEEREHDEVRDDRRAAVGDERQRDPRQRHEPQDAADDDERLQRETEREPDREQLREAVLRDERDAHAARDETMKTSSRPPRRSARAPGRSPSR